MKTRLHFAPRFIFGSLLILAVAQPGFSQGFEFTIAPYVLIPSMTGEVTVRGRPVEVDVGPGDIFKNLDFGAMLRLEASNQDWAFALDGLYMNLGADGTTPLLQREAKVDMKQLAVDARALRRVAPWAEIGIGGRINVLEGGLSIAPGDNILSGLDVSQSMTWFDPLIVARLTAPLESKWHLGFIGDIGGFGIGSDFAWQVYPFVGYRFSTLFELTGAFRALGMKYETGTDNELFIYDMVIFGPEVGFLFHL
jgi:hypothetical protein